MFNFLRAVVGATTAVVTAPVKIIEQAAADQYGNTTRAGEELDRELKRLLTSPLDAIEDILTDDSND